MCRRALWVCLCVCVCVFLGARSSLVKTESCVLAAHNMAVRAMTGLVFGGIHYECAGQCAALVIQMARARLRVRMWLRAPCMRFELMHVSLCVTVSLRDRLKYVVTITRITPASLYNLPSDSAAL